MKIAELIKKPETEGKEKHVPYIEVNDCKDCNEFNLKVKVGKEVLHPTTLEHHIEWIEILTVDNDSKLRSCVKVSLQQGLSLPVVNCCIKKENVKEIIVLSFCNIHGLWENSLAVS